MHKRHFLKAAACGALGLPALARAAPSAPGATVLTICGAVRHVNRGPFDAALDQLIGKHGIRFENAHALDLAMIAALPAATIVPTLEYDGKPHRLRGPRLSEVLALAGTPRAAALVLHAIDGYRVETSLAELQRHRFILATHLDDAPLGLGGLGPLWAVCDADRFADLAAKPLAERFAQCPWGAYLIEVSG